MNGNEKGNRFIIEQTARKMKRTTRFTIYCFLLAVMYFFAIMFPILTLDFF